MTDALDKLRKLEEAASPGPWTVGEGYGARVLFPSVPEARPGWDMTDSPLAIDMTDANAQLAALSHLLRPAFEALEKLTMLDMEGGEEMLHAVGGGMAVLASLEAALKMRAWRSKKRDG